ncbi:MAG: hypothetical protein GHCLOJNM_00079 [bacterium]|nr:hypothetical protein [bacterium]
MRWHPSRWRLWRLFLNPRLGLGILVLILLLMAGFPRLVSDNSIDRWLRYSESERADRTLFRKAFGSDDFILVALEEAATEEETSRPLIASLKSVLEQNLPEAEVVTPYDLEFRGQGGLPRSLSLGSPTHSESPDSLGTSLLFNPKSHSLGVLLFPERERFERVEVEVVREVVERMLAGRTWHLAGPSVFNEALSKLGESNERRLYPFVGALLVIAVAVVFRSLWLGLLASLSVLLCVLGTYGLAGLAGIRIDLVSGSLPPLLMVICLTSAIHLLKAWQRLGGSARRNALPRALRETSVPSFLAAVTTAVGFGSFAGSDIPALSGMGILAPFGVVLGWLVVYSLPSLSLRFPGFQAPALREREKVQVRVRQLDPVTLRRRDHRARLTLVCAFLLVAPVGMLCGRLSFESNPLLFFKESHPLPTAYRTIESHLIGLSPIEAAIHRKGFDMPVLLKAEDRLRALPEVVRVFGAPDLAGPILRGAAPPLSAQASEHPLTEKYVDNEGDYLRLTVFAKTLGSSAYTDLLERVDRILDEELGEGSIAALTGVVPTVVRAQDYLLRSQFQGLGTASLVIFLLTLVGLRSIGSTLIFMIPNIAPVLVLLALLALFGVSLDVGTIMVASVTLGIAVDDSYHVLWAFARARRAGLGRFASTDKVRERLGGAIFGATAANSAGFLVLCLSTFPPMRNFGILVTAGLWLALLAEWLLMPALLAVWRPRLSVVE